MDEALLAVVATRLDADANVDDEVGLLVLAAMEGDDALVEAVSGEWGSRPDLDDVAVPPEPKGAYLQTLTVEGFRGVGPKCALGLTPGPGLTLVVGRNGSGKSSFVEALEVLLTGDSRRWSARKEKAWREGWRNLHQPNPTSVSAEFVLDGVAGTTDVVRSWGSGVNLDGSEVYAQEPGAKRAPLETLGWDAALAAYRPILSYNELGSILDEGPSKLYDALVGILGLDDLTEAQKRLGQIRLASKKLVDAAKAEVKDLLRELDDIDDDRARTVEGLLAAKHWDLDRIGGIATGTVDATPDSELEVLRSFAHLAAPDLELVAAAVARAREAADLAEQVRGTEAETAARLADLLEAAVDHHTHSGDGPCPVCGVGGLDAAWEETARAEIDRLRRDARAAQRAADAVREATRRVQSLQQLPAAQLPDGVRVGLTMSDLRDRWEEWLHVPTTDLRVAADRLEARLGPLVDATVAVRAEAAALLAEREDRWAPVAEQIAAWLDGARRAQLADSRRPLVETAEGWVKQTLASLRNERLAPLAAKSQEIWGQLSQHSNVTLGPTRLTGSGTTRRATLDVAVDGKESVALAVMSQGELHSLALAVFLPRVTATPSPFRFLVIDDPVQAMDPARVEGLARVLEETAKTHQVIVLTHDDRLPQAVRLLGIEAKVLQVTRRPGSVVEVMPGGDPASVHLDDGMAVALTSDLPDDARARVVPGYCRLALESVLNDVARRKLLASGVPHADVEEQLTAITRLNARAALALFGDAERGGEVMNRLGMYGPWAQDAFKAANKGTHDGYRGDLAGLVRDTQRLVEKLRTAP